ncbi:hypothetical protein ACLOJK_015006 [Asimina triloba]
MSALVHNFTWAAGAPKFSLHHLPKELPWQPESMASKIKAIINDRAAGLEHVQDRRQHPNAGDGQHSPVQPTKTPYHPIHPEASSSGRHIRPAPGV